MTMGARWGTYSSAEWEEAAKGGNGTKMAVHVVTWLLVNLASQWINSPTFRLVEQYIRSLYQFSMNHIDP